MTRLIANVLTRGRFEMSAAAVVDALADRFGEQAVQTRVIMAALSDKEGFVLDIGGTHLVVAYEPFAMPFDELRPPETTRRDEFGLLTDHRAHAMLGVLEDSQGREKSLRAAMALLQVASVLADSPGASAVLWSPAQSLTAVAPFRAAVAQASAEPGVYPLTVLCRVGGFQDGTENGVPRIGVVATGLARFIGRDLEFAPKPRPLADMINSTGLIANWLFQGMEIEDGHTYGRSDRERFRIHVADRGKLLQQPVLMCDVEDLDASLSQVRQ